MCLPSDFLYWSIGRRCWAFFLPIATVLDPVFMGRSSVGLSVTQYPIPAITVPGRMRYSRHKRSGISYGCHNESPRTFSCHKRSCFAISYPLSRIYCRCRMYRRFGVGVSADDCSLLPPPSGSSMAMQIARSIGRW